MKKGYGCSNCGTEKTLLQKKFDQPCRKCGLRDWDIAKTWADWVRLRKPFAFPGSDASDSPKLLRHSRRKK